MNPHAAATVCVPGYLQGSQIGTVIGTIGTINGCVYAASGGWVSTWPAGLHIAGMSSVMNAGSRTEMCLALQCVCGSATEGCETYGYDAEKMEHVLCFQLLSAWDSLGCQKYTRFGYLKIKILGFQLFGIQFTRTFSLVFLLATGRFGSVGFVGGDFF